MFCLPGFVLLLFVCTAFALHQEYDISMYIHGIPYYTGALVTDTDNEFDMERYMNPVSICDKAPKDATWQHTHCHNNGFPSAIEVLPLKETPYWKEKNDKLYVSCRDMYSGCGSDEYCNHDDDVYIKCAPSVKLHAGASENEGFLLAYLSDTGKWGFVCMNETAVGTNINWAISARRVLGFCNRGKYKMELRKAPDDHEVVWHNPKCSDPYLRSKADLSGMNPVCNNQEYCTKDAAVYLKCLVRPEITKVFMLFDVSESMKPIITPGYEKHFLTQQTDFLQKFFDFIGTEERFWRYPVAFTAVPFNTKLFLEERWDLNTSKYVSASQLRAYEKYGLDLFKDGINGRAVTGKTNIGAVLKEVISKMKPEPGTMIYLLSDFVNMFRRPRPRKFVRRLRKRKVKFIPVLLDSPHRNRKLFAVLKNTKRPKFGFDIRNVNTEEALQMIFDA